VLSLADRVAQVVRVPPSKLEALSSNPSAAKKSYIYIYIISCQALVSMPIILATQELRRQRSGESWFEASPGQIVLRSYLEKKPSQKGLVEWLKV
jgi:hypothetical protein